MATEHHVNLSFQLVPLNCAAAYPFIDAAIAVVKASGHRYAVSPFATFMEGPLPELLATVEAAKAAALAAGAEELLINLQIHLKAGADVRFEDKTAAHADH